GWRLAHPAQFKHAFKIGLDHISAFLVTLIMTLAVDLLVGIFSGLLVEFTIAMLMGVKWNSLFKTTIETKADADNVIIETLSPVIFSNSLSLRAEILENLDSAKSVTVNLTKAEFIDHTVMDLLDTISKGFKDRGSDFKIMVSPQHKSFSDHALASKKMSAKDAYLNV
ncbi:MAG: STAS domain-containing protein, partial [Pseudobdellovibrionaceae bacterium]